jgi:hypothetical protein
MSRQCISLVGILVCTSVFSLVYAIHERSEANVMESSRYQLDATLSAAHAQIQALSSRLDALTMTAANTPDPPLPVNSSARSGPVGRRRAAAQPSGRAKDTDDARWKRVESQLANHQLQLADQRKRIAQTQENVRRTGDRLDGRIDSTRNELSSSITTTHDDVVRLQKRGERSIYEFELTRSKQFQQIGPLSLSLRKTDTKRRSYDLSIMVDDKPVEKRHVNLSEPIWISLADLPQPIEVLVNQIDKNRVRGHISAPRYKNADFAVAPASGSVEAPTLKSR